MSWLSGLAFVVFAPVVGGLLAGIDRKLTARMQGRVGPPLLQPFYDVQKLMQKETLAVRPSQNLYIHFFFLFTIFTGMLFFSGGDLLLVIFSLTIAGVFFALAGYKASSPYSFIGAHREVLQMMSYEPAVLLAAVGMYMITGSFQVSDIVAYPQMIVTKAPGLFLAFFFILAVKFRKSPFDLSTSHHAHQELVKGITTEYSGKALAILEVAHWYEYVFVLGIGYLFFASNVWLGLIITFFLFELVLIIDNTTARVRWQAMLASCWIVALVLGGLNIVYLMLK